MISYINANDLNKNMLRAPYVDGIDIQVLVIGEAKNYDSINQLLQEEEQGSQPTVNSSQIVSNDFLHFF
jgi:hypothetical protein